MKTSTPPANRGHWKSRFGFILAAAGSAVGLGNIWKFPYITGEYGGGLFVLIYLACIAVVGLPVMIAEVMVGRATQKSPVGAFESLADGRAGWKWVGWMGVITGFIILSYYSVVAGWSLHYVWFSVKGAFTGATPSEIGEMFGRVYGDPWLNLLWHVVFMLITMGIISAGVQKGIEAAAKFLMPALLGLLFILLLDAILQPGFPKAFAFLFSPKAEQLSPAAVLEALGHSFFTLSLGMGAMLTYGSYLSRDADLVRASVAVCGFDTAVAFIACLVLFPVIFSFGMAPQAGPGLVFKSIPIAFSQMTGGAFLSVLFFVLLFLAALTSAISLLEVVASNMIDRFGWPRKRSAWIMGLAILVFGIPSALSGGTKFFGAGWEGHFGRNWFDGFDHLATNWLLPLGGLATALFVGWFIPDEARRREFGRGGSRSWHYVIWLFFLRYLSPGAMILLFLFSIGVIPRDG